MLPDVITKILPTVTRAIAATNTATTFVAQVATRGPAAAKLGQSFGDFATATGARIAATPFGYDFMDVFFREGAAAPVYFSRVISSTAKAAKVELKKGANGVLVVEAGQLGLPDPGAWGNELKVAVTVTGSTYKLTISNAAGVLEESYTLTTIQDAITWARKYSHYVVCAAGAAAETPPDETTAKALTGGSDGGAIADADWQTAINMFTADLGPGQITLAGETTAARQLMAIANAVAYNRFFVADLADTPTRATLVSAAQALYTAPNTGRNYVQPVTPWEVAPGIVANTSRTVPGSARLCAQYAKVDSLGNPNRGAAGFRRGVAQYVEDLSQPNFTDADREALNEAGITVSRRRGQGLVVTSGIRTLADPLNAPEWRFAPGVRTVMAFVAIAGAIAEQFQYEDVSSTTLAQFKGALIEAAKRLYDKGALGSPLQSDMSQAFRVDTGEGVNTPKTLEEGKLIAQVALKVGPNNETTLINVVRVPLTTDLTP